MDNNFNMQSNNANVSLQKPMEQQPMYQQPMQQQPMYQQPMYQQPMYQQPAQQKSNTGLIIAIVAGAVVLLSIIAVVLVIVLSGGDDLIGKWTFTNDDEIASFEFKDDNTGTMVSAGLSLPITWTRDGDKLSITMTFFGQSSTENFTIKKLDGDTLVISDGDEDFVLTRAD